MATQANPFDQFDEPATAPAPSFPGVIRGVPSAAKVAAEARANSAEGRAVEDQAMQRAKFEQDQERIGIEREKLKTENIKATEGQSKAAGFLTRALRANKVYEDQGIGARSLPGQKMAEYMPGVLNTLPQSVGNSPERQVADATQDDFIAATLRYESGAAIPSSEIEAQRRRYFPMPGDGEEVLKEKAVLRQSAIDALKASAGGVGEKAYQEFMAAARNTAQPEALKQVAITGGENFSTDQDKAIAAAVQSAFQQGGGVQELTKAAESAGGQVRPEDLAAFQQAIEARDKRQAVTFNPQKTGRRSPIAQAAGEALMSPVGTAVTGAVNAAGLGALSLFAGDQVQGLEALNPKSAVIGEIAGSALGTGALAAGARQGIGRVSSTLAERLAGGGFKGALARTAATDAAYGGIYAANTGEDIGTGVALGALGSLVGAGVGAGVKRASPAFRGMFRGNGDGVLPPFDPARGGGAPPSPVAGAVGDAVTPDARDINASQADEPFAPITTRSRDAGASGTSDEMMRLSQAEGLPVPVNLTVGAAARDAEQLAFEKEQIFGPLGQPLRARAEENNLQVLQNFDRFIDLTGAQAPDIPATGNAVIKALSQGYKQAKDRVNVAYKRAEVAGDMAEPVPYKEIADYIAEQTPTTREKLAPVLSAVAEQLRKNDPDGTGAIPLNALEEVRKLINKATTPGTADANYGGELKGLIDQATEGKGGALYKKARALRIEQARKFENRAVVERLVSNVKNKADAKTTSEEVFRKSILNESPEDIKFLRHALKTSGKDGRQAWKEMQGATVRHIQDAATSNVNLTSSNEKVVSAAALNNVVEKLDKNGRLDAIFDPATAQRIRDLRDVVQYVNTVPPGTSINNSGTARTLLAAMAEMGGMGAMTGVPVPLVTGLKVLRGAVQDNRIKKKISQSLIPKNSMMATQMGENTVN